jgi:NAD(P)-dependent dehydrogenase (short-subunit alcohol dehydrogenase family)
MEIRGTGALVVGGASGLGEAAVRELHRQGAVVTIADVDREKGAALAGELGAPFVGCDVRDEQQVQAAVDRAAQADGLRICVCCAGTGWAQRLTGGRGPHPLEAFERVIAVNLVGTFNVLRLAATKMLESDPRSDGERGVCINTASIAAFEGQIGQVAYAASKGGVVGLTLPAARELAAAGIRVLTIAPGLFDTPLLAGLPDDARTALAASIPFPKRLGLPAEYARLAAHAIANRMLNGETIRLDGALRMAQR